MQGRDTPLQLLSPLPGPVLHLPFQARLEVCLPGRTSLILNSTGMGAVRPHAQHCLLAPTSRHSCWQDASAATCMLCCRGCSEWEAASVLHLRRFKLARRLVEGVGKSIMGLLLAAEGLLASTFGMPAWWLLVEGW